ncbi:MAG: hypothetical protein Ta2E_10370 [Mycoplasmoidaceae bacterium]|nr:MAG: hypothetical protein Ta2E_10370 [Mycoplasmoidaceae bacterium]
MDSFVLITFDCCQGKICELVSEHCAKFGTWVSPLTRFCNVTFFKRKQLSNAAQIFKHRFNTCNKMCKNPLKCGHVCQSVYHSYRHKKYICQENCRFNCKFGHVCQWKCGTCQRNGHLSCVTIVHISMPCGHSCQFKCYIVTSKKHVCIQKCDYIFPTCGHKCNYKCHKGNPNHYCEVSIQKKCLICNKNYCYQCQKGDLCWRNQCTAILVCGLKWTGICGDCTKRWTALYL